MSNKIIADWLDKLSLRTQLSTFQMADLVCEMQAVFPNVNWAYEMRAAALREAACATGSGNIQRLLRHMSPELLEALLCAIVEAEVQDV